MRLSKNATLRLFLGMAALIIASCAHSQGARVGTGPVTLRLKSEVGAEDLTRYYSRSQIEDYELGQKTRDREEIVDFQVREKVLSVDPKSGQIRVLTTTIAKDGTVDLHDLAFPEKKEEIEYLFAGNGDVLKAGDYPPDSLFFIPPLPLPKGPVTVGDTWEMHHAWVGLKSGIPLGMHLMAILKEVKSCGAGTCAEIEMSGDVEVIGLKREKGDFNSKLWGRLVMSVDNGSVVWSEMRSRERMVVGSQRTDVLSCMRATLVEPKKLSPRNGARECTPSIAPVGD